MAVGWVFRPGGQDVREQWGNQCGLTGARGSLHHNGRIGGCGAQEFVDAVCDRKTIADMLQVEGERPHSTRAPVLASTGGCAFHRVAAIVGLWCVVRLRFRRVHPHECTGRVRGFVG